MFSEKSRYAKTPTETAVLPDGREGQVLKLRKLPASSGRPHVVTDNDQLDMLAHQQTGDGTKFWHIADANTELEASNLLRETGATINLPNGS